MERLGLAIIAAGLGTGLAALAAQTWRASQGRAAKRAAYFNACAAAFTAPRLGIGSSGFPRLAGGHQGATFDLQAVPDTLTYRKLPALWLLVTLPGPLPVRATLDLMIRPTGVETFSHFQTLAEQIKVPDGFPADCALRTDDPSALLPESVLRAHLGIFDDPRVKELVISPKGLRISYLAEEANRGRYLIFREAELGQDPLESAVVTPLLTALLALRADILALPKTEARP
jgi:hypothetical protein